jgi:hypothetical protein
VQRALRSLVAALLPGLLLVAGCEPQRAITPVGPTDPALALLDQGWTPYDVHWFSNVSQGSRLMPLAWYESLERAGSTQPFAAPENIARYRYLPRAGDLPVGFAEDRQPDSALSPERTKLRWFASQGERESWVGMTCAACHTGQINHRGHRLNVIGGPTMADYQGFIAALNAALAETAADDAKFARFGGRVLEGRDTPENRQMLRDALARLLAWQQRVARQNVQVPGDPDLAVYGFGRLDALGHIVNKTTLLAGGAAQPAPADAPVSYPALWNTPQLDRVEWNGMVRNSGLGPLMRNAGQVIGVFGDVVPNDRPTATSGFRSSVESRTLVQIENRLESLRPPAWPTPVFGPIDQARRAKGAELFAKHCASCHMPLERSDLTTLARTTLSYLHEVGTDVSMACNVYAWRTPTGMMKGMRDKILVGPRLGAIDSGVNLMKATVVAVLLGETAESEDSAVFDAYGRPRPAHALSAATSRVEEKQRRADYCLAQAPEQQRLDRQGLVRRHDARLTYKARPLTGIWATAPYLHNGSVPTLHDLLLPPERRPTSFYLGASEFDPVKVGFTTGKSADNSFEFRTDRPGNSNAGHLWGTGLDELDRSALIEYLKSL